MRNFCLSFAAIFFLVFCGAGQAQRNPSASPDAEQRIALVIGNSSYKEAPLRNPVNDAADVAATLKGLGFNVILRTNANRRQMVEAVREFGVRIRRGGVGFFYYAGHGVQSKGKNFLIPVGAQLDAEADLEFETMDANMVLAQMDDAGNRVNIVVLDACRDNPFARSFRSASRGLAQMDSAKGSFLAYATSPGSVAADGTGRNGTYTKHLLASLRQPDSRLEEVFKRVRVEVAKETGNRQIPWDSSSVLGDFYFRPPAGGAVAEFPAAPAAAFDPFATERTYWDSIKDTRNANELKTYLDQYPGGMFAALAAERLKGLAAPPIPSPASGDNSANERAYWDSVKDTRHPEELQAYIDQFPNGLFTALARNRLRVVQTQPAATKPAPEPEKAKIYITRDTEFFGGYSIEIYDGEQRVGGVQAGSYFSFESPVGERAITALVPRSLDPRNIVATERMKLETGKTYYLRVEAVYGPSMKIEVLDENNGKAFVAKLMPATADFGDLPRVRR